jgi:hypothetical protein
VRESAIDVITKQLIEARREAIARRSKQADTNLKRGLAAKGNLKALYEDLKNNYHSMRSRAYITETFTVFL